MKTLICFTLLACHAPKKEAFPLWIAGQFDAATTVNLLRQPGSFREENPLFRPFAGNAAAFPAMFIGNTVELSLLERMHNHKILRAAMLAGFIGLHVWCGFHNLGLAEERSTLPPAPEAPGPTRGATITATF